MQSHDRSTSVNTTATPLVAALLRDAQSLRLGVQSFDNGCTLIDAGVQCIGGLEAGRRIAEISLAGLGQVSLGTSSLLSSWPWQVRVSTRDPLLACVASQMAGWRLSDESGRFEAIGSGPARALFANEKEFEQTGYCDHAARGYLILEADCLPPPEIAENIARDCGIALSALTLIVCPTQSLAGAVQIAARVIATTLLKMGACGLPADCVVDALGSAPLPPAGGTAELAMGRTNDSLRYGGQVHLFVRGNDELGARIAQEVPSCTSASYGKLFSEVIAEAGGFYKMDAKLFAPAKVSVSALDSGRSFNGGKFATALLERSFNDRSNVPE